MEENNLIKKYWPFVLEVLKIAVIAFVIVAPIRYFLFQPFIVSGESMSPNLENRDYLIVDEISYRFSEPQRGDVIVFNAGFIPGYENQRFIKRVIGTPGETVNITSGQVKIIETDKTTITLDEKYLPSNLKTIGDINVTLETGQYFVMGDNRDYSYDSRMWGVVSRENIVGKASLRLLPLNEITIIK